MNDVEKDKTEAEGGSPERHSPAKLVLRIVLIAALIVGIGLGVRYWVWTRGHASTDDAYITTDVVQISPQVSGTVQSLLVEDNELVKRGQLLVTLDDSTYRAAVAQANANLGAAMAQARSAGVNVNLVEQTGAAGITQAQGTLSGAESSVESAKVAVARSAASLDVATANERNANAKVNSAAAVVARAKSDVESSRAALAAAQAKYENSAREAKRFATLAKEGAASQEVADAASTDATAKKSDLDAARENVQSKQSSVEAAEADLNAARQQVSASAALVQQSKADLAAARQSITTAEAGKRQAQGGLSQAQTAPTRVAASQSDRAKALASVEQARAALRNAELQLSYCRIYAPIDGRVSKKSVEVGELVQPGTPLMALIPPLDVWVVANFKETQMKGISPGYKAEIEVDAVPGQSFAGHVDSIAAGTGSTFALLPPENATGNFVKVVQRVPVKIVFDPNQPGLQRLHAGMSVTAIVESK